jgi:predicted RNA-binding Zn-ribbon protein involved in translation (DUF1610 family)
MTLDICNEELVGYCESCGLKMYDCYVGNDGYFHCPNCDKKYLYKELSCYPKTK